MTPQAVTLSSEHAASPAEKENYASFSDRSASPSSDIEHLERKTKELDTAKLLIKQMQADRKTDREALTELKRELEILKQTSLKKSENIEESEAFRNVQSLLASMKEERDALVNRVEELESQLIASKTCHDDEVARLNQLVADQQNKTLSEMCSLKADHDRELSARDQQITTLKSEIETQSEQVIRSLTQLEESQEELKSIRDERVADETGFKDELNRISSEMATQQIQTRADYEKQLSAVKSFLSQREKEVESLTKCVQVETDSKNSLEQKKNELEKRVRLAESKQVELEDALVASGKLVTKTQALVKDLEQQVEIVESEKCLVEESLKTITTSKNQIEKSALESNERSKQLNNKLASAEKQVRAFEDQIQELKNQVNDKGLVVKQFTNDLASLRRASDNKVRNVAVIAALIAFVISRLIASM